MKSLLVTTMRNLVRNPLHSFINIAGLAVGLAACLLILVFVQDELGYDRFIPAAERTYRLDISFHADGRIDEFGPAYMGAYGPMIAEVDGRVEKSPDLSRGA